MGFPNRAFFRRACPTGRLGRPNNMSTAGKPFVVARGTAARFLKTGKVAKGSRTLRRASRQLARLSHGTRTIFPAFCRVDRVLVGWQAMKKSSSPAPRTHAAPRKKPARWSAEVTRGSDALDLESGVFTWKDPKQIAASLKHSAETSDRKKADPFRSALSMLTFYINRAGANLPESRRRILTRAKGELRKQFGRI
jgi:Protein of unknown function (DUF3175)